MKENTRVDEMYGEYKICRIHLDMDKFFDLYTDVTPAELDELFNRFQAENIVWAKTTLGENKMKVRILTFPFKGYCGIWDGDSVETSIGLLYPIWLVGNMPTPLFLARNEFEVIV